MSSLCTNPEQSSSPQTLEDELSMQEQLTKLEIMCAEMQNENEQLIREAAQHKQVDEELADCIEKLAHLHAFASKFSNHSSLQSQIESQIRQLLCHVSGDIDIISEDKWLQCAYKQANAFSFSIFPAVRCVGDFWKHRGTAALASTTEERDHHINLVDQAHSRYQQFVQEEVTQRKTEENTIEVLKLCKEADNLSSMRDYHAAEQCYLHALKILPEHAQSLCNYAHLLHTGKKELDKAEELFKKSLQSEPHRAPTLFNYAAYLLTRGQV